MARAPNGDWDRDGDGVVEREQDMVPAVNRDRGRDRDGAVKQEEDITRHATVDRDVPEPSAIVNDLLDILRDGELEDEERQMEMEDALEEAASRRHDHDHTHTHTGREPLRELKNLQRPGVAVHEEECDCGHPFCESLRKLLFDQLKKGGDAAARCDPGPELLHEMLNSLYPEATGDGKGDGAGTDKDVSAMLKLLLDEVHDGERDEDNEEDEEVDEEEYEDEARDEEEAVREEEEEGREEEEYDDDVRDEEEEGQEDEVRDESVMDDEEEDMRNEDEEVEEEAREEEPEGEEDEINGEEDDQAGEEDEEDEMREEEEEEAAGEAVEEEEEAKGEEDEDAQIEEDDEEEEEEEEKEYDGYNDERDPNWVPPDEQVRRNLMNAARYRASAAASAQDATKTGHDIVFKDAPTAKRARDDGHQSSDQVINSSKRQRTLVYGEKANLNQLLSTQKNTAPSAASLARPPATKARVPRGDWPHLRSSKKFSGFSLVEQSQTLKDWMSDIEDYVESINAGAIPTSKVLAFFQRVNAHLNSVTETLDDIALGNERVTAHYAIVQEEMRKADLEKREIGELLGRFTLPSVE